MRLALAVLVSVLAALAAGPGAADAPAPTLWLPIVATRSSVSDALASAAELQRGGGELRLVATDDCQNLRKELYVVAAGIHASREAAESAIAEWRKRGVADAYLRSCKVVVPSRLSLGIPLLDPSLTRRPIDAVNWGVDDAVSRVVVLGDRAIAVIVPRYEADPEDIREGLRIGVRLYILGEQRSLDLSSDCIDPEFALNATHLALTCVNETAGTHLLHRTQLYALADGQVVAEHSRCTTPTFEQGRWVCQKESVDAEGNLKLRPTPLRLR